jgi:hypothetical protein
LTEPETPQVHDEPEAAPGSSEPLHPRPPSPLPEDDGRKGMSETLTRILTAAVLVPAILYVIVQGGLLYLGVVVAFVLLGQREFYRLIEEKGARPLWSLGLAAARFPWSPTWATSTTPPC